MGKHKINIKLGDVDIELHSTIEIDKMVDKLESARAELEHLQAIQAEQLDRGVLESLITEHLEFMKGDIKNYSHERLLLLYDMLTVFSEDE